MSSVQQLPSATDRAILTAEYEHLSPARLFQTFTDPALLAVWWALEGEVDGRVGGAYHLWWSQMNWHLRGTYSTFSPGERLAFSWKWDHETELPARTVTIDFSLSEGVKGAKLTLTHGFYTDSAADVEDRQGHIDGWLYFLSQIDKVDGA